MISMSLDIPTFYLALIYVYQVDDKTLKLYSIFFYLHKFKRNKEELIEKKILLKALFLIFHGMKRFWARYLTGLKALTSRNTYKT